MKDITIRNYSFKYELDNDKASFEGSCLTKKGTINVYRIEGSKPSYEVFYSSLNDIHCNNAISELIDFLLKKLLN